MSAQFTFPLPAQVCTSPSCENLADFACEWFEFDQGDGSEYSRESYPCREHLAKHVTMATLSESEIHVTIWRLTT